VIEDESKSLPCVAIKTPWKSMGSAPKCGRPVLVYDESREPAGCPAGSGSVTEARWQQWLDQEEVVSGWIAVGPTKSEEDVGELSTALTTIVLNPKAWMEIPSFDEDFIFDEMEGGGPDYYHATSQDECEAGLNA
jgi:hypothetical protein